MHQIIQLLKHQQLQYEAGVYLLLDEEFDLLGYFVTLRDLLNYFDVIEDCDRIVTTERIQRYLEI